jgi:uncharacterized membrane protein
MVYKFWLNHHHVLSFAMRTRRWRGLNAIFPRFQSYTRFPTALTGRYASNPLAVSTFGAVVAFNTMLFITLDA